jgi:hypothetical protein
MTSGAGRLPLTDLGAAEGSREATLVGVAKYALGAAAARPGVFVVLPAVLVTAETTTSSSSTKLVSLLGGAFFFAPGMDHSPFGSMVTCSTDSLVLARISRAYLGNEVEHLPWEGDPFANS